MFQVSDWRELHHMANALAGKIYEASFGEDYYTIGELMFFYRSTRIELLLLLIIPQLFIPSFQARLVTSSTPPLVALMTGPGGWPASSNDRVFFREVAS